MIVMGLYSQCKQTTWGFKMQTHKGMYICSFLDHRKLPHQEVPLVSIIKVTKPVLKART